MDSILWSSGLFAADGNQWKEISSQYSQISYDKYLEISGNAQSVVLIMLYGGKLASNSLMPISYRLSFQNILNYADVYGMYLPAIQSVSGNFGVLTNALHISRYTDSSARIHTGSTTVSACISAHVFDPV